MVVLGDGGVGKTALTSQFIHNVFVQEYDPTIEDSYRKQVSVDGESIVLDILDTAGPEEFSALRDQYIRDGQGFIIVYSITSRTSFEQATIYRDQVLRVKDQDSEPMILIGNKSDLEEKREVTVTEGRELAKKFGCPFLETSAKTRINVDECFLGCVSEARKYKQRSYGVK